MYLAVPAVVYVVMTAHWMEAVTSLKHRFGRPSPFTSTLEMCRGNCCKYEECRLSLSPRAADTTDLRTITYLPGASDAAVTPLPALAVGQTMADRAPPGYLTVHAQHVEASHNSTGRERDMEAAPARAPKSCRSSSRLSTFQVQRAGFCAVTGRLALCLALP